MQQDAHPTASAQPAASTHPQLHHLQPEGLYDATPNGYTHVVAVHGPAQWAFVSGQGGENQAGDLPDSFAVQAQQALSNLKLALQAAGADMGQVVKLTLLIVDHSEARFNDWQAAVRLHWGDGAPGDTRPRFPACTLIPVPRLALPGMLIEVDAVAALPAHAQPARPPLWV
ncbi:MAG: RidA family protein [Delftia acidovorans]|jgi:enamine deaminase RidA (YjgF/YER057c/UK114 family)|nr:RidA family protein [Delftia acidovorans]